ncbi:unnamed protein product, partial [Meganyctiphanes norvegica]
TDVSISMMRTFSMMLGEVDFLNSFIYPFYGVGNRGSVLYFPKTTFAMLLIFMILMPILLMNLLIGLAVGDIESVKKNAQLKRIAMQVALHTKWETKLPRIIIQYVNKDKVRFYPNAQCTSTILNTISKWLGFWSPYKDCKDNEGPEGSQEDVLWDELEHQKLRLKDISGQLDQQTKLLRLIMQKMEIVSEADDTDEGVTRDMSVMALRGVTHFKSAIIPKIKYASGGSFG